MGHDQIFNEWYKKKCGHILPLGNFGAEYILDLILFMSFLKNVLCSFSFVIKLINGSLIYFVLFHDADVSAVSVLPQVMDQVD